MNSKSGKNIIVTIIGIVFQYLWQSQRTSTVRRYVFAVTIAGILLLTGQWSQAQTIYVDACDIGIYNPGTEFGTKEIPFNRLSDAVKVAANGQTIQFQNGVYMEKEVFINKRLTLKASGGLVRIGGEYDWGKKDVTIKLDQNTYADARLYFPKDPGKNAIACREVSFPAVVYLHGFRYRGDTEPCDWLDSQSQDSLRKTHSEDYKQAEGILKHLAKVGIIAISVDWHTHWDFKQKDLLIKNRIKGISDIAIQAISYLQTENWNVASWLATKVDLKRLGMLGHSNGGAGAIEAAIQLGGLIKAVGLIAPVCPTFSDAPCFKDRNPPRDVPILVIHGTHDHKCQVGSFPKVVYCGANRPKHFIYITGANHFGYTDFICIESNGDKYIDCPADIPTEPGYMDSKYGRDNPSMVGNLSETAAHTLQQRTAGNYLRAFFMHYLMHFLDKPTSPGYINYLIQKNGSCNCSRPKHLEGGDPRKPFADLRALDVEVKICSEQ